jgi:hypothetical protein
MAWLSLFEYEMRASESSTEASNSASNGSSRLLDRIARVTLGTYCRDWQVDISISLAGDQISS